VSQTRCTLAAVVCTAAFAVSCLAQTNPTFTNVVSKSGPIPVNMYAVDLNGDGFPDMVQDTAASPNGFTVSLANGDGTYKAPVTYMLPSGTAPAPIATGDFNNDGKADLAIQLTGTNQIAVYLGNGDGTFQAPKTSTIALPGGQVFASAPLVTADYNKDGKLDLVAVGAAGSQQTVYVVEGDGTGGFATPQMILNPPAGSSVGNLAIGDFDDDAKADVALTVTTPCSGSTSICNTTVHALYGNGAFGFTDTTPYSTNALFIMSAGDANSANVTTADTGLPGRPKTSC